MTIDSIRELKKKLGISNAALSDLSGVSLGTVNKALSGASAHPRRDTMKAMWDALKKIETEEMASRPSGRVYSVEQLYRMAPADSLVREEAMAYGVPATKGPGQFTIEDYYALPDDHRVELIDGVFYDMAAPSIVHQNILLELAMQVKSYIRKKKGGCHPFIAPVDVMLDPGDDRTIVQPDFMIVCKQEIVTEKRIEGAPDFICEIVSPSSQARDYYKKGAKYEEAGVKEYWILDPKRRRLTIYNYFEKEPPCILPLQGKVGLRIYNDELQIDLDEIAAIL